LVPREYTCPVARPAKAAGAAAASQVLDEPADSDRPAHVTRPMLDEASCRARRRRRAGVVIFQPPDSDAAGWTPSLKSAVRWFHASKECDVPKNKVVPIDEAMSHIKSGMTIAVGGFIGQGDPLTLIDYLKTMDVGDLTIYENDAGYRDRGVVELVRQGKIKKIVASHIGTTPEIGKAMNEGRLIVEATPQGTLAEMMRCGGAGLGGFLTPTGIGTIAEEGKQIIELDGRKFILVPSIKCDVAIVRAHRGDTWGNLIYRGTSRNFNVPAAMCAEYVISEVENLYTMGELDPEGIHTSGIFVDAVVRANVQYCTLREEDFDA
jgi:acetate CoA/acetoacetate CoA-transferase alpha subunit